MKAEIAEGQMQETVRGLGGVSVTGVGGIEHVADLSTAMLGGRPLEQHVPDQLAGSGQLHTKKQRVALGLERVMSPRSVQPLPDV